MRLSMKKGLWLAGASVLSFAPALLADDAMEILKKADDAAKSARNVSYAFEVKGIGISEAMMPQTKGTAFLAESDTAGGEWFLVTGTQTYPADSKRAPLVFKAANDGTNAFFINDTAKTFQSGTLKDGAAMVARNASSANAIMIEFVHPTPFSDEINGESRTLEGVKEVGGVPCDVILVQYGSGNGESRWYFGKNDHLPRAVERISKNEEGQLGGYILSISDLNANAKFETGAFTLTAPDGYKVEPFKAPAPRPALIAEGTVPPDWTLETPTGEKVTLSSLKGNIVLLDFWATWCGPCKKAMPGVQALHEHFAGKPVKIFGVNTWERGGDPVKYMKDQGFTYGLLMKGDDVASAYKVTGIPTFYLIGPDGKVMWVGVGAAPDNEQKLQEMIEKKLKEMQG